MHAKTGIVTSYTSTLLETGSHYVFLAYVYQAVCWPSTSDSLASISALYETDWFIKAFTPGCPGCALRKVYP